MRITKEKAEKIAKILAQKKADNINNKKDFFVIELEKFYLSTLPEDVLKFHSNSNNYPYLRHTQCAALYGFGFNHESFILKNKVPFIYRGSNCVYVELTDEKGDDFLKLHQEIGSLQNQYKEALQIITSALIGLSTIKRIKENFPEAIPYLPEERKMEIAIKMDDVRKLIA